MLDRGGPEMQRCCRRGEYIRVLLNILIAGDVIVTELIAQEKPDGLRQRLRAQLWECVRPSWVFFDNSKEHTLE